MQTNQTMESGGAERKLVDAVVGTLSTSHAEGEKLAEVAHDARNMVMALGIYCDLLEEPGVLAAPYKHYGNELRLVAAASRRLVEKLVSLDTLQIPQSDSSCAGLRSPVKLDAKTELGEGSIRSSRWDLMPAVLIDSLAGELLANRNLLCALAGPTIAVTVDAESGRFPVRLNGEDLTRVLVNLVKNAAEAMPAGGKIQLSLREQPQKAGAPKNLVLTVDDSGPGIPGEKLDKVFETGFSTRANPAGGESLSASRRGLGLSITRSIVEAAGGRIVASNCDRGGARIAIELPVRTR